MDSDEDELGVFDAAATPYRVEKYVEPNAKATKTNGRTAVAGPSSKPPSKVRSNSRKRDLPSRSVDENAKDTQVNGPDDAATEEESTLPPRRSRSRRAASREPDHAEVPKATNVQHGKGKARAKDAREPSPQVMDVDSMEEVRADAEEPQEVPRIWGPKRNQHDNANAAWKKREERHRRELERVQRQCQDALIQRDNLARQLEELFHVRNTEAETKSEQQAAFYESRIQAQEEMIQELTSQLARVDSLTREGKTSTLHFLTRDAADEERRGVERQVEKLKQVLKEKDKVIVERDAAIRDQAEEIRQLRRELDAEIERSKSLASSQPNGRDAPSKLRIASTPKSGVKLEGLKATHAHRLYEDLTNILILDCHCEYTNDTNEEQWVYSCLYAPSDNHWNIAFALRAYHELEDGEVVEKVAYTPREMSDKSEEWLARLDFLAEEFTFHRRQLDVFLDKLYQAMNEPGTTEE